MRTALFLLALAAFASTDRPQELDIRLPKLASVFPQGSQPGRTVRVDVLGEYLDRADSVVFLDPAIRGKILRGSYTGLALEFLIDAAAPYGPHYFRIVSPRGASNILLFRVGDQPHVTESEPNSTFADAQQVSLPVTINGRLDVDGDFDFFRFHAEKGQNWIFDVRSARNGNGLDPALILLDSHRRELAHSEDVFIWDPFFQYKFQESGDYVAVVQPTHAHVDPNFAYQLDIRAAPHLETLSPLSMPPGSEVEATLFGAGLTGPGASLWFDAPGFTGEVMAMRGSTARVKIHCPPEAADGPHHLAVLDPGGRSNPVTFLVDRTPRYTGGDHISPPVSITSIARYRQPERFWLEAKAGQTLVFEVRAQRFGSPVDSILRILDETGKQIGANDDGKFPGAEFNKDSYLVQTFEKSGRYQLEMRNLWKTTGEDFPYELVVRPPKPSFELMLDADNPSDALKLTAERREGFEGPIAFEVRGLSKPIRGEVPAAKNTIQLPLPAGARGNIQVFAGGKPAWRSQRISSGGGEGATFAIVDRATVAPAEKPLFLLEAEASTVPLVRGGSAEFNVSIQRTPGFHDSVDFSFENLPAGVTAHEVVSPPDATSVNIRLQAAKDAPPARSSRLAILGRSAGGQVQEAPKITVVVD